jgi:hypothetical protein
LSSNFCLTTLRYVVIILLCISRPADATSLRFADVIKLEGRELASLHGQLIERLTMLACTASTCRPIPFQVDERDVAGQWVLDQGPLPTSPPGVFDANDVVLFRAADAGAPALPGALPRALQSRAPASPTLVEITLRDPLDGTTRWVYLAALAERAPRAPAADIAYDPTTDRVRGQHVSLGFVDGVPGYLAVHGDPDAHAVQPSTGAARSANLLDRLKVRVSATFLFGLIHFARSEADLRTEFMGWHAGPIRVVRGQRQWVRLGWGIHSPTFGSYTYFYRDFAELPVGLYLNFKPTHFFGNILVQAILDFRDLKGWSLIVPSLPDPIAIDGTMTAQKAALDQLPDKWFALRGPEITLVESMDVSPSLATVRHRLLYRETTQPVPPESVRGEEPGIGYQLDQWEHVGAGAHQLQSVSYALPLDLDPRAFMRARATPMQVKVVSGE